MKESTVPSLPIYPSSGQGTQWQRLRIKGLVANTLDLTHQELLALPQEKLVQDFRCEEGWTAPYQVWEGVPVAHVLRLSRPLPEAMHLAFSAGNFSLGMTLAEAEAAGAILALRLNNQLLPVEHGGPCRLVVPGRECFTSIKWVDQIQVSAAQPPDSAREIALARIGRSAT